ncbi:MAG: hypothetical protein M3R04_09450, partial [bacterium]|nr:hypothetical protein [bacterium]
MRKIPLLGPHVVALIALALLGQSGCQGTNQNFQNPQPRSREAGLNEELPPEEKSTARKAVDGSGGQVQFGRAKLTVPVGAINGDPFFVEIAVPKTPPVDVIAQTAV